MGLEYNPPRVIVLICRLSCAILLFPSLFRDYNLPFPNDDQNVLTRVKGLRVKGSGTRVIRGVTFIDI